MKLLISIDNPTIGVEVPGLFLETRALKGI